MSQTKYLVNNINQSIDGNFTVTGTVKSNSVGVYKALFTQTDPYTGITSLPGMNGALIPGETYTIATYQSGDDFSNIADVTSGTINQTGCVFVATGKFPTNWSNGSSLNSDGDLVVDVIENTLGYDISWSMFMGAYVGVNATTGPWINSFPRNRTSLNTGLLLGNYAGSTPYTIIRGGVGSIANTEDVIYFTPFDFDTLSSAPGSLYYQYIEINAQQYSETDTINITVTLPSFPCGNASISLYSGNTNVHTAYTGVTANDVDELASIFNDPGDDPSMLGTYSVNLDGELILTMSGNLKLQFSPDNDLTAEAFND
jgi:hypothetical protein